MQNQIRILHVEYLTILRDSIRVFIQSCDGYFLSEQHQDLSTISKARLREIDLVILGKNRQEYQEEGRDVAKVCQEMSQLYPKAKIILHSDSNDTRSIAQSMNAGAFGYVSKIFGFDELLSAFKCVGEGKKFISNHIHGAFKNTTEFVYGFATALLPKSGRLSGRELEVLSLVAKGFITKEIAQDLSISTKTVESHRKNIVYKLEAKNTAEAIRNAHNLRLI